MTDLSPAAQAVLNAVASQTEGGWISLEFIPYETRKIAAALEAVVAKTKQRQYGTCWICDANELLAIATELEAHD